MRSLRLSEFTLAACVLAVAFVAAQPTQLVRIDLTLPGGATPSLKVNSGESAQLVFGEGLQFELRPTLDRDRVALAIYDTSTSPQQLVEELDVAVGGAEIALEAYPGVGLSVSAVDAS